MEKWRKVWRDGIVPHLTTKGLVALERGLNENDARLIQGATTSPPPSFHCVKDRPVEACCVIGYCTWQGDGMQTAGEVEESFASICFEADQELGKPAECRYFLNWYDEVSRGEMLRELLAEVKMELAFRREDVDQANLDDIRSVIGLPQGDGGGE